MPGMRSLSLLALCALCGGLIYTYGGLKWLAPLSEEDQIAENLINWVRENGGLVEGIKVGERYEVIGNQTLLMRGLVTSGALAASTPVIGLPKAVVPWRGHPKLGLPVRNLKGLEDVDVLTLFWMKEFRLLRAGVKSFWEPYARNLDSTTFDNPQIWAAEAVAAESMEFQRMVELYNIRFVRLFAHLTRITDEFPELKVTGEPFTYHEFLRAKYSVQTRRFAHDRDGGGGGAFCDFAPKCAVMYPVLDMGNHDWENYSLSPYVSLGMASHGADSEAAVAAMGSGYRRRLAQAHDKTTFFVKMTGRSRAAGEQVWNKYFTPQSELGQCKEKQLMAFGFSMPQSPSCMTGFLAELEEMTMSDNRHFNDNLSNMEPRDTPRTVPELLEILGQSTSASKQPSSSNSKPEL